MKEKSVLSHMALSLALFNSMMFGIKQIMEVGGGYLWIFMALGSAFLLGMQVMFVVIEGKEDHAAKPAPELG